MTLFDVNGAESQQPFIRIDGLENFRDIGSWPTSTSNTYVRSHILFRGPELDFITWKGEQQMRDLGISKIFDIRSVPQIERAGVVKDIPGIERIWCPVFEEAEYTPDKAGLRYSQYASDETEGIVQAFEDILSHGAIPAFKPILQHLGFLPIKGRIPACMIHCTTGNNRSGVFIGVLLSLLGVPAQIIANEYALSQIGLEKGRGKAVDRLMKNQKFIEALGTGGEGRRRAERMVGTREESMTAMLEMVERKWGGAVGYVKDVVGLSEGGMERVREAMTERREKAVGFQVDK